MFDNVDDDNDDLDDIVCCGSDVLCLEHVRFVAHPAAGGGGRRRRSEDEASVGPNDGATCRPRGGFILSVQRFLCTDRRAHRICRSTASRSPVLTRCGICVPPTVTYLPYRVSGSTLTAVGRYQLLAPWPGTHSRILSGIQRAAQTVLLAHY